MMMLLLTIVLVASTIPMGSVDAFSVTPTHLTSRQLSLARMPVMMDLAMFGGGKPKSTPSNSKGPSKAGGKDLSVFGGKAKKITVREDEDAAMWFDEPVKKDTKKPDPKKKGR
jgi:hypothetical protein